ncbi:hypothetical protein RND71_044108 [Anisodus tanguticus]|uniref:PPIase cyclophilin-type domain-containing protein n=1 Tax=Anisodus tanguticus TaxID=243964 RepID=A0AAE1UMX9_9SOLA|nr:hypothetical protein RND71_044108 [Anisodus tanguticus]
MEGYYNNTIFHRVVKDFIVQGGDATGTGLGGESIYGEPFKDEFHSRLKFGRRGLVALANAGKDDNSSQFFFTMGAAPELQNKHTIFGKVTGTTIFNMLKLQEGIVDQNERPEFPQRIISIEILKNPFDDIVPREIKQDKKVEKKKVESKSKATKDFKLLSFGDEAEEEEENLDLVLKSDFKIKKSYVPDLVEDAESTDDKNKEKSQENKEEKNTKKIIESFDKENSSSEDEYEKEKKKMEQVKSEIEKLKKEVIIMKKKDKIDDQKKKKSDSLVELEKNNEKFKRNFSSGSKREQQTDKSFDKIDFVRLKKNLNLI